MAVVRLQSELALLGDGRALGLRLVLVDCAGRLLLHRVDRHHLAGRHHADAHDVLLGQVAHYTPDQAHHAAVGAQRHEPRVGLLEDLGNATFDD
eukprot:4279145-Prymnesium_polylepis.1